MDYIFILCMCKNMFLYLQVLMHSGPDMKADGQKNQEKPQEKRTHQPIPLVSDTQTHPSFQSQQKQPQVLSQQLPFIFQSSQAKEESVNKHTSVIQSTGLVPNVNPLSLVNQAKKETFLKLIVPSPGLLKAGNKNTSEEPSPLTTDVRSNRVSRPLYVLRYTLGRVYFLIFQTTVFFMEFVKVTWILLMILKALLTVIYNFIVYEN